MNLILDDGQKIFENKSVALIGPSSTLEKSGLGKHIDDQYDVVCRINHHIPINNSVFIDYGKKTDVVFTSSNIIYNKYNEIKNFLPNIIIFPRKQEFNSKAIKVISDEFPDKNCFIIDEKFNNEINEEIETIATTGMLSICYLLKMNLSKIFIAGFDFYQNRQKYYIKNESNIPINGKYEEQINKYGFIKYESEHDMEKHIKYFNKLVNDSKLNIKLDSFLEKTISKFN